MPTSPHNGAALGFEDTLWAAADKLRGHMDPAEYKHVVLGLVFLKYISDAFNEQYVQIKMWTEDPQSEYYVRESKMRYEVLEDRDEYLARNVFGVPKEARWPYLQANAKQPTIGQLIDDAMVAIEDANPTLKGMLPKNYARPMLNKQRLGELIDLIGTIGLGDKESRSMDILGRDKSGTHPLRPMRDRRGKTLFIDARQLGELVDRTHRRLSTKEIDKIVDTYHAWRGDPDAGKYEDEAGFCYSAMLEEIQGHDYVLTPGRYVGIEEIDDDDEPFEAKMEHLTAELEEQFEGGARLEAVIHKNLRELGWDLKI